MYRKTTLFCTAILAAIALPLVPSAAAAPLPVFANPAGNWRSIAEDDLVGQNGWVGPGYGGQNFDAEYLYCKRQGSLLTIGLQTGFNLATGAISYNRGDISETLPPNFWAGDLALSFDGSPATYEYAIDFGFETKDFHGHTPVGGNTGTPGIDTAGLYRVSSWNSDIYYTSSGVFAMQAGDLQGGALIENSWEFDPSLQSYARIVTIDLSEVAALAGLPDTGFTLDAHWTMSCGNDFVEGSARFAPVPEPATLLLLGIGLTGIAGMHRRKIRK